MPISEIGLLGVAKGQPNVPVSLDFGILVASVYNSIHYPFQNQKGLKTNKQTTKKHLRLLREDSQISGEQY